MWFQLPPKRSNVFCLVNLVRQPVPEGGCALWNDLASEHFLFLFSPNPETLSLHREEEQWELDGLYWETSSRRHCGAVFIYTLICDTEDFVLDLFWDRQPVQWPQVKVFITDLGSCPLSMSDILCKTDTNKAEMCIANTIIYSKKSSYVNES